MLSSTFCVDTRSRILNTPVSFTLNLRFYHVKSSLSWVLEQFDEVCEDMDSDRDNKSEDSDDDFEPDLAADPD